MARKYLFVVAFIYSGTLWAQEPSPLDSAVRRLASVKDPQRSMATADSIIRVFHLDREKDGETFDLLYGTVAVNLAMNRDFHGFDKYIGLIRNQFNRTSFMNMAASQMLNDTIDIDQATLIAQKTLALYDNIRNDSTARPAGFSKNDWERFMAFAQYPYYDTYALGLFLQKQYRDALAWQEKAFDGPPEQGLPQSVERYAQLLELTGNKAGARELLLKMASIGRLNKGMTNQLQSIYISEHGSDKDLGLLLDSLQRHVQKTLAEILRPKMLDEKAPPFTLKDINGKTVRLADFAGKIVVLDLWATWCKPCIASFPAMRLLVNKHPEITFLFIAVEEKESDPLPTVKRFIEKRDYPFTVLLDEPVAPDSEKFKITSTYKPNGIPAKYIIDKNGILRFRTSGFDTDTELINELEAMFSILRSS